MKKRILQILSFCFILAMLFSLSACKTNTSSTASGSAGYSADYDASSSEQSPPLDLGEVETIVDKDGEPYVTPQYNMRDDTVSFLSHWDAEGMKYILAYLDKYGGPQVQCLTYNYND